MLLGVLGIWLQARKPPLLDPLGGEGEGHAGSFWMKLVLGGPTGSGFAFVERFAQAMQTLACFTDQGIIVQRESDD